MEEITLVATEASKGFWGLEDGVTVLGGLVLSKAENEFSVIKELYSDDIDEYSGYLIKPDLFHDIMHACHVDEIFPHKLYPALCKRIRSVLDGSGYESTQQYYPKAWKNKAPQILLIGNTGNMRKAVALLRVGNDFMLHSKADGPAIMDLEDMVTDSVLIVGAHDISLLYRHKFTRPGRMLSADQEILVSGLME